MKPHKVALTTIAGFVIGAAATQALHAQVKPPVPVYVVIDADVKDLAAFKIYADRENVLIQSFGGQFLVRGGRKEIIAGTPPMTSVSIILFENSEKMRAWRSAPEQKELTIIRDKYSDFRSFAVEGLRRFE